MWIFALLYLLLHAIIATCLPDKWAPLSTFWIVIAEWAVAAAAFLYSRRVRSAERLLWWLLAFSSLVESLAMCVDMATEVEGIAVLNYVPATSIFLSMLYGLPLLVAVSIQFDRRIVAATRTAVAILSLAIGSLLYVQIFSLLSVHGSVNSADALLISHLFDAIDLYLALAATIRWLGADTVEESAFFRIASIFLWLNALLPAIHNRILLLHDYVWLDVLLAAPYAVLFVLLRTAGDSFKGKPHRQIVHLVQSGSPLFLSVALLLIAVFTTRTHFYLGLAAALLSVLGHGVLSMLAQSRVRKSEEALLASKSALEELVGIDKLTGIANRWAFDEALAREHARTLRTKLPVSLLMIDVDYFKLYNDANGHQAGDDCLTRIAATLRAALPRSTDLVARYGGEEFAVILPATSPVGAAEVAARVCRAITDLRLLHATSRIGFVTISVGVSTYDGSTPVPPARLTAAADRALYNAKRLGRNRCEWFSMDTLET